MLENSSGAFSILLNRAGVTADNPWGYADNGMNVIFSDGSPDFHLYQTAGYATNGAGQVTGTWGPDGRNVLPLAALDTSPRTAPLADFLGTPADGTWTLFLVDASSGGTGELAGWSLTIATVPEPTSAELGLVAVIFAAAWKLRRSRAGG
jgi:hypothetical protein